MNKKEKYILNYIDEYLKDKKEKMELRYKKNTNENYVEIYDDVYIGDLIESLRKKYDITVFTNYEQELYTNLNMYRAKDLKYENESIKIVLDLEYVDKPGRKETRTLNFYEIDYNIEDKAKMKKIDPFYITDDCVYGQYINSVFNNRVIQKAKGNRK